MNEEIGFFFVFLFFLSFPVSYVMRYFEFLSIFDVPPRLASFSFEDLFLFSMFSLKI